VSTTSSTGVARWGMIGLTGLILTFADADAQQQPQTSPSSNELVIKAVLLIATTQHLRP
jgi:hypothetical protein